MSERFDEANTRVTSAILRAEREPTPDAWREVARWEAVLAEQPAGIERDVARRGRVSALWKAGDRALAIECGRGYADTEGMRELLAAFSVEGVGNCSECGAPIGVREYPARCGDCVRDGKGCPACELREKATERLGHGGCLYSEACSKCKAARTPRRADVVAEYLAITERADVAVQIARHERLCPLCIHRREVGADPRGCATLEQFLILQEVLRG